MTLPLLDLARPGFSTRSREVLEARKSHWCAKTPFGFAVLRHRQAGALLRDRRLRQGSHAWPQTLGLRGRFAEFWSASLISLEGAAHRQMRQIAQEALAESYIAALKPAFHAHATELVEILRDRHDISFIDGFSEPYAGRAITTLLALPDSYAPAIARDAARLGLAMGFDGKAHEAAINGACERLTALAGELLDRAIEGADRTSYVARLWQAAERAGGVDRQALMDLVVISIFGGVDTTRAQLAFTLYLLACHPAQYAWLRTHPEALPQAIEEAIRIRPTTTWATRQALETFDQDGVTIPEGAILHILVHATATDPASGGDGRFDIRARRKVHFGFGGGTHHCLGQLVARTDMAAALTEILARWQSVTLARPPEFLPDTGNTAPRELILTPQWAAREIR